MIKLFHAAQATFSSPGRIHLADVAQLVEHRVSVFEKKSNEIVRIAVDARHGVLVE